MATGVELAVGSATASCCLNCCCNQLEQYVAQAEDSVRDLKSEAEKLNAVAADVKNRVSARQMGSTANAAENWLRRSAGVTKVSEEVSDEWAAMCMPSINFWSRYRVGRRASRELGKARELIKERAKLEASTTASLQGTTGLQEKQIETTVVGMDPYLRTALGYILDNDAVGVVGVCGMGGVGKTTLLRKIHGEFLPGKARSKEFDKIVWAVVSKKSTATDDDDVMQNDIASLQNDIARELCLLLDPMPDNDDDNCSKEVLERRAQPIYEYLSSRSFLVLLDDLWSPLELRSIGVPDPNSISGARSHKHKVVLTSRSETVCGQMHAASGLINVQCLEEGDAWYLFQLNATKQTIASHKAIRDLAWKVMKECQGLPLALNTIGKALSTKFGDPRPWRAALTKLRAASHVDIPGMEVETAAMLHRLKISYDYLPSQRDKDCFLSCCLWPEDYSIGKAELVECWLGLGIIPDSSSDINTCLGIITSLKEVHLLEPGDDDATEVKMHDTIRDMSLWISSNCGKTKNKWLVKSGTGTRSAQMVLRQWHEGSTATERVSFMNNHIEELPSDHIPRRTMLKVLMLQRNKTLRVVPGSFLQSAPSLTYLDLSNTMIEELPSEIRSLGGLHYLNLSESHINKLPDELSFLTELRYLLLSATISLSTMPHGIISKLRKLQILDVFQSKYSSWDAGIITSSSSASPTISENGNCANLSEFTDRDKTLKGLGITVDTVAALKKLARCDLVRTKRLCLKRMETPASLHVLPSSLGKLLGGFDMLRSLQEFMLSTCALLKEIIIDGGSGCREQIIEYALPELEKLELVGLYNLEQIRFRQVTPNDVFPSLSSVQIFHCYELKNLNWLLQLPQLLHFSIHFCDAMKAFIDDDDVEQPIDEIEQEQQPVQPVFPLVKTLTIHSLGSLTCLCRGRSVNLLPALEILEITQCSNLKQLNIRPQGNLKEIRGGEKWWNDLCWEEDSIREELLPYFKAPRLKCNAS